MSIKFTETYSHILFDEAVEKTAAVPDPLTVVPGEDRIEPVPAEAPVMGFMLTSGGDPIEFPAASAEEPVEVLKAAPSAAFLGLSAEIAATSIRYVPVEMPCRVDSDGHIGFSVSGDETKFFTFSPMGISYLGERFKSRKSGEWVALWVAMLEEGAYSNLENALNADPAAQEGGASRRFILAIYNGEVVGTPKRYIPVDHKRLLDAVEAAGLASAVEPSGVGQREMWLNVHTAHVMNAEKKEVAKVGLRISNGHSGHTALRFYAYCTTGEHYEYAVSLGKGRSRHLGKVEELVDDLAEMEKTAAAIDFEMALKTLKPGPDLSFAALVADAVKEKKHETDIIRLAVESTDGLDFFESLVTLVEVRDYRVAARAALDVLMAKALSL